MTFPQPNSTAIEHSNRLSELIQQDIQQKNGYISFARYMELALYSPGLGYYSAGAQKFGPQGDFVTAPELSPLFAQCIARQCQQVLNDLKENGDILEFGAGSGVLASDLLLELETLSSLPKHYFILETSADLRERQQTLLKTKCPHLFSRVAWLDQLPTEKISGVILANEVADALPTHCFSIENQQARERCVTWSKHQFIWKSTEPTTPALSEKISFLQQEYSLENGYTSEINLLAPAWINTLADTLNTGLILLFDYGYGEREYYHPDRHQGTLMCYYQHHKHSDPFLFPGLQDITAHVNFTSIIEAGMQAGLSLGGYTTQAAFLIACGLSDLTRQKKLSDKETFRQNQVIKTLTLPSQMGEAIKVMGLTKNWNNPLIGLSLHNRSRDL